MSTDTAWVRRVAAYRAVVRGWPADGLLACSGGVDSSALLVLAGIAVARGDLEPFPVVYVDHRTRPDSAADGDFVAGLADRYGLEVRRTIVDPDDARDASSSAEDQLRVMRYAALGRVASELGRRSVVTAHTRDDQVETVLMRLLTGTGGLAAAGMTQRAVMSTSAGAIAIHRPLLETSRSELLEVLARVGIAPREDPTNLDPIYRRNRLRHDVIPSLRSAFPGFETALLRAGTLSARDADALDEIAGCAVSEWASGGDDGVRVDRSRIREAHPAIGTRVIRTVAGRMMPKNQRELTYERVESVRVAASGRTGAVIELPYDVVAIIERESILFTQRNS
jgi:tRNA(Ile)-lysidine synthetase-like protein